MNAPGRPSSRDRIMAAAVELANEVGPGHVSLDAVAQRAGVSKGGLLYNFPSKAKLLEAIVAYHLDKFEDNLQDKTKDKGDKANSVISACVDIYEVDCKRNMPPESGILAALVENPNLLLPARDFSRGLIDRIRSNSSNQASALVVYMALEGLRCLPLLDLDVLSDEERELLIDELRKMADVT